MNFAHLHLLVNHFSIMVLPVALVLFVAALKSKSESLKIAANLLFVACAGFSAATYFTGESAEHLLEKVVGETPQFEALVEAHEEAGLWALILNGVVGIVAAVSLLSNKVAALTKFTKLASYVTVPLAFIATLTNFRTGYEGGKIRHSEMHDQAGSSVPHVEDHHNE